MESTRQREAIKQKNMDANYDDDVNDSKFYKLAPLILCLQHEINFWIRSSALKDLRRERELEIEWEKKDRILAEEEAKIALTAPAKQPVRCIWWIGKSIHD